MCIILGPVVSVSRTKLFVLPNKDKTRQMTFYSNAVHSHKLNMMILPVPKGDITLHTINYKEMFDHLKQSVESLFKQPSNTTLSRSSAYASASNEPLLIISHGSYLVSIAYVLEDLLRLDRRIFDLTPELFQFFQKNYTSEFSYICCVLKPGLEAYEPLCYSHPLHLSGTLFVPTMHYHNHGKKVETTFADWDHLIYSIGTSEKANRLYKSNYSNSLVWSKFPSEFQKLQVSSVRCTGIKGHQKNEDLYLELW